MFKAILWLLVNRNNKTKKITHEYYKPKAKEEDEEIKELIKELIKEVKKKMKALTFLD